jgi:hypothetical protein
LLIHLLRDPELVFDPIGVTPGTIAHYLSSDRREKIFEVHVKGESGKFTPFPLRFVSCFPLSRRSASDPC